MDQAGSFVRIGQIIGNYSVEQLSGADPIYVFDNAGQLDISSFQNLLKPIQLPAMLFNQALPIPGKLPQFPLLAARDEAGSLCILHIGFASRQGFHV